MSPAEFVVAFLALMVGGTLQGAIGFGSMLVAAPILILVDPRLIPGPATIAATVLVALIAFADRSAIDRRGAAWTLGGRVPGTLAGGLIVATLSRRALEIVFGVLLLLAVGMSMRRGHLRRTPPLLFGVGAISGLMGTATSVGGPPLALAYQHEDGPTIRGTLNVIFLLGGAFSLATLAAVGELGRREWWWGLVLSPGIALGFGSSRLVIPRIEARSLRPAVLGLAAASAAVVLVRALAQA